MTHRVSSHYCLITLIFCTLRAGSVMAHALPGSLLTFSPTAQSSLRLSISLPLEDLILAEPTLSPLQTGELDQRLPADSVDGLNRYFSDHMVLKRDGAIIPWSIEDATLQLASNEHVGTYTQLKLFMKIGAAVSGTGPGMMLNYDAVMHEIRNHRATVLWHAADNEIVTVARFGFRPTDGVQQDIQLHMPTRQP